MDQNPTPAPEAPVAEPMQPVAAPAPAPAASTAPAAAPSTKKGLAIAALICGICSLVFCWAGCVGLVLAILGVILGIVALVKKQTKGMSIAGLVCGAIGIVPGVIFTLLWIATFSVASVLGGVLTEAEKYENDPVAYCEENPYSMYCEEEEPETCEENLYGSDCEYDSDEYWEAYCEEYPFSSYCEEDEIDWMDDFVEELFIEEGAEDVDQDVKDEFAEILTDYVLCLNENGLDIDSAEAFGAIFNGDTTAITEADLTISQSSNIVDCSSDVTDAIGDIEY